MVRSLIDRLGAGRIPASCARLARSVDRSIPPWATRSASYFSNAVVEPAVRRTVAEHLGVDAKDLAPGGSLADELAADSLDLVELALALEAQWGIPVPGRRCQDERATA